LSYLMLLYGWPYSLESRVLIPEVNSSYSEARYNRHAFTYLAIGESTDRFVPISLSYFAEPSTYAQ
jgi:hypothetical protein